MSNNEIQMLSLVVPCYNDGPAIPAFLARVLPVLESLQATHFEVVFVNDGSTDDTLARLVEAARSDGRIRVIDLTRSFGRDAALTSGIDEAVGDAVIPFDAGLKDPPELIPTLVQRWRQGAEVVLAQSAGAGRPSFLKRLAAVACHRLRSGVAGLKPPMTVGEFRLMDRAVVNALKQLPERHRCTQELFAWVGFNTEIVQHDHVVRSVGLTGRPGWRLGGLAFEGVTSFNSVPLRSLARLGVGGTALAICYGIYLAACSLVQGAEVPGYAPLLALLLFFVGLQLIGLGLLGTYIGRIYDESKGRPIYLVKRRYQARRPQGRVAEEGRVISLVANKHN